MPDIIGLILLNILF